MSSTKIIKDVVPRSPHFLTRLWSYGDSTSSLPTTEATSCSDGSKSETKHSQSPEDSTCSTRSMSFSVRSLPSEVEVVILRTNEDDDEGDSTELADNCTNHHYDRASDEQETDVCAGGGGGGGAAWMVDRATSEDTGGRSCTSTDSSAEEPGSESQGCEEPLSPETPSSAVSASLAEHRRLSPYASSSQRNDLSLHEINQGLRQLQDTDPEYWTLILCKAKSLARNGYYKSSLALYERLMQWHLNRDMLPVQAAEMAELCFAAGRLSVYLGDYGKAVEYYQLELAYTQAIIGPDDLAVARIYHDLARVAECGLGDLPQALGYYLEALRVERAVWDRTSRGGTSEACPDCHGSDAECVLCQARAADRDLAALQMQETRQCMGRIHFALGDIEKAVQLSVRKLI